MSKFVPHKMWLATLIGSQELNKVFVEKITSSHCHLKGGRKLHRVHDFFCLADEKQDCIAWLEKETEKKIEKCEDDILRNIQHIKFIRGKMLGLKEENK